MPVSDGGSDYALNDLSHCEGDKRVLRSMSVYVWSVNGMTLRDLIGNPFHFKKVLHMIRVCYFMN